MQAVEIKDLVGKTFDKVVKDDSYDGNETLTFYQGENKAYMMGHSQDCCEEVSIEDMDAELDVLEGTEILEAEVSTKHSDGGFDSETWTFYKFRTAKGWLTVRWYGTSNGYYSEEVDLVKL